MRLTGEMQELGELHSCISSSAVGCGLNVHESTIYIK